MSGSQPKVATPAVADREGEKPNAFKSLRNNAAGIGFNVFLVLLAFLVVFVMLMPKCFTYEAVQPGCSHPGLPNGMVFDVMMVLVAGTIGGVLVSLTGLPPLLGMLIAGYVLRNLIPNALQGISAQTNSTLRNIALAVIMIRAGMGLDLGQLRRNAGTMGVLSVFPCVAEATTIAGISQIFFPSFNIQWGFLLGFVIADVSPAVTTPLLLDFMSQGYGVAKGIPSILLAAGSVNSVVAIVLYFVVWEFAWGGAVVGSKIAEVIGLKLIVQIFGVGVVAGWLVGLVGVFWWKPAGNTLNRFAMLFLLAMALLFGFKPAPIQMSGGGTLATLSFGATVQFYLAKHIGAQVTKPVQELMALCWGKVGQVVLFTLLGASIDQKQLDSNTIFLAFCTVLIGLVGRSIACFISCAPLRSWVWKEKAFAMVTWCPKATVQAALATQALDYIRGNMGPGGKFEEGAEATNVYLERGNVILTTAVLSIIMTAPLFAVLMAWLGKLWLTQSPMDAVDETVTVELPTYDPSANLGRVPTALTALTAQTPREPNGVEPPAKGRSNPKTPEEEPWIEEHMQQSAAV